MSQTLHAMILLLLQRTIKHILNNDKKLVCRAKATNFSALIAFIFILETLLTVFADSVSFQSRENSDKVFGNRE